MVVLGFPSSAAAVAEPRITDTRYHHDGRCRLVELYDEPAYDALRLVAPDAPGS